MIAATTKAKPVGAIGERLTLDVSVIYSESFSGDFGPYTVAVMRTVDGFTVKTIGQFYKAKGWTGKIKATVKKLDSYKGEPVTIVQRVKSL